MVDMVDSWAGRLALVIDDEPDFRTGLEQLLVGLGFRVRTAASGSEALARLKHESPDLIFLDLFMPGMDGIELLRKLQASGAPVPPVIAVTGYVDHQSGVGGTAELLGARAVLFKPFTRGQLEKVIESVLFRSDRPGSVRPGALNWVPRRVRFLGAASLTFGSTRQFNVRLQRVTGESVVGEAGGDAPMSDLRGPAEAAVDGLRKMVGGAAELKLRGILPVAAFGQDLVVASLNVVHQDQSYRLFGVSPITEDRARASALATLNAANRFLGLG